jgi:hypothetical protein
MQARFNQVKIATREKPEGETMEDWKRRESEEDGKRRERERRRKSKRERERERERKREREREESCKVPDEPGTTMSYLSAGGAA